MAVHAVLFFLNSTHIHTSELSRDFSSSHSHTACLGYHLCAVKFPVIRLLCGSVLYYYKPGESEEMLSSVDSESLQKVSYLAILVKCLGRVCNNHRPNAGKLWQGDIRMTSYLLNTHEHPLVSFPEKLWISETSVDINYTRQVNQTLLLWVHSVLICRCYFIS